MRKPSKKSPRKIEDPEQSQRFLDLARELEAAGGRSPTEAEIEFERAFKALVGKPPP
jgi:hypothetical protein